MKPINIMNKLNEEASTEKVCCLCGKKFTGYGNSAWPLDNEGTCCDDCNMNKVLPARLAQMYGSDKKINESEDEGRYYDVVIGFGGYIGVENEYHVYAKSRVDAVGEALDNPGSEAEQDLSVDEVEDLGDGNYECTVSFAGILGADNQYRVYAESEEDAQIYAIDEAKADLEVISVDGEEFSYDEAFECAKSNKKSKIEESGKLKGFSRYYNTEGHEDYIDIDNYGVSNTSVGTIINKKAQGLIQIEGTTYVIVSNTESGEPVLEAYSVDYQFPYTFKLDKSGGNDESK